ncbi:hypothetical protein F4604DRAFT_1275897 [Suillus subluteus]|nr:hypothetical protein F4604DRAFT_1275897 [Suillus subluteus]
MAMLESPPIDMIPHHSSSSRMYPLPHGVNVYTSDTHRKLTTKQKLRVLKPRVCQRRKRPTLASIPLNIPAPKSLQHQWCFGQRRISVHSPSILRASPRPSFEPKHANEFGPPGYINTRSSKLTVITIIFISNVTPGRGPKEYGAYLQDSSCRTPGSLLASSFVRINTMRQIFRQ